LIWIKGRVVDSADVFTMTVPRHPAIRHCPVCRIAMQAAKSREDLADFDMFRCLACDTIIRESKSQTRRSGSASES
jgi:hypothetical protein